MQSDKPISGLRNLSAANRTAIESEIAGSGDPKIVPSARFAEDAIGTRLLGPMGKRDLSEVNLLKIADELNGPADPSVVPSARFDDDTIGTRSLGPMGKHAEVEISRRAGPSSG